LIGGFVINQVNTIGSLEVPVIGKIYPWQLAFVIVSVPGLLLALVVATLREPLRRTSEPKGGATSDEHKESFPVREMVAYLIENRASIGSILFGFAILATVQFGLGAWVPTFFIRTYGWTATDIGYVYGLYFVVFGSLGVIVGGWISDWLFARGNRDANLRVGFLAAVLSLPFVLSFPLVHDSMLSVILLAPVSFFGSMPFGAGPAALPMIVPNRMRAQLVALYLLLATLLGQGVGPWLIAVFTDYVMGDPSLIRYSMASVCSVLLVVGASVLWLGRIPFAQKVKELSAE
jgi:MFS family permease